ncbi:MAG: lipopolysaccharide biosynthesis protein [Deltaproteobacteria bacterium]|nr:lipopolysaccharide biosynthesis protein [Deltaproteobacteria bacterium]
MLKRVAGNAAYMFVATSVVRVLSFAANMLAAKIRTKENFGDYNTYVMFYGLVHIFLTSGAAQTIQKFATTDDEARKHYGALAYRVFFALLVLCGLASLGVGFGWKWTMAMALWGAPWLVVTTLSRLIIRTRLDARREARIVVVGSLSTTVFQLGFLLLTDLPEALIYGDLIALVITGFVGLWMLPAAAGIEWTEALKRRVPHGFVRDSLRFMLPTWGSGLVGQGGAYIRMAYTRGVLGTVAMGVIGLLEYLWQFIQIPIEALSHQVLPGLVKETEDRPRLYRELTRLCLIAFPLIGVMVAGGVPLLFQLMSIDEKWAEIPTLFILGIQGIPVSCFLMTTGHYAIAEGKPSFPLYAGIAFVATISVFLYPLGHVLGLAGVVIAQNLALVALAIALAALMWRSCKPDMRSGLLWSFLSTLAIAASSAFLYAFSDWPWRAVLVIPAAGIYIALLFVFGVARRSDVTRLVKTAKEILESRRKKSKKGTSSGVNESSRTPDA